MYLRINTWWCILDTWAKSSSPLWCAPHHPGQNILISKSEYFAVMAITNLLFDIGWSEHGLVIRRRRQVGVLGWPGNGKTLEIRNGVDAKFFDWLQYHHLIFIAIEISWPHWGSRGRIGEDPSLGRRWVVGVRHCVPDRYNHHKTWRWRWPLLLQCWCWWLYDGFDILIMHANENMDQICVIILFDAIIYLHQIRLTLAVPQGHNRG